MLLVAEPYSLDSICKRIYIAHAKIYVFFIRILFTCMLAHYSCLPQPPPPSPITHPLKGLQLSAAWQRTVLKGNASLDATVCKATPMGWQGLRGCGWHATWVKHQPKSAFRQCAMYDSEQREKRTTWLYTLLQFTVKLHTLLGAFPPDSVYFGHSLPSLFLFFGWLTYTVMHFWLAKVRGLSQHCVMR